MTTNAPRRQRADAARNVERIVRAAREVYAEQGSTAQLDDVARQAGVGISTLFRHFPDRKALIRAALHLGFTDQLEPVLQQALADDDPYRGLVTALESSMTLATQERRLLSAATELGIRTFESTDHILEVLVQLVVRAQEAGRIRADLVAEDVPRLMLMLVSVLSTMEPGSDGWRRYVGILRDALEPVAAHELSPAAPLVPADRRGP